MKTNYDDLLLLSSAPPIWFDEHGVPRFCPFKPELCNPYATEIFLILIECSNCKKEFKVVRSFHHHEKILSQLYISNDRVGSPAIFEYQDPPNVSCCSSGPSMMSVPKKVLEIWTSDLSRGFGGYHARWNRLLQFELDII